MLLCLLNTCIRHFFQFKKYLIDLQFMNNSISVATFLSNHLVFFISDQKLKERFPQYCCDDVTVIVSSEHEQQRGVVRYLQRK